MNWPLNYTALVQNKRGKIEWQFTLTAGKLHQRDKKKKEKKTGGQKRQEKKKKNHIKNEWAQQQAEILHLGLEACQEFQVLWFGENSGSIAHRGCVHHLNTKQMIWMCKITLFKCLTVSFLLLETKFNYSPESHCINHVAGGTLVTPSYLYVVIGEGFWVASACSKIQKNNLQAR